MTLLIALFLMNQAGCLRFQYDPIGTWVEIGVVVILWVIHVITGPFITELLLRR